MRLLQCIDWEMAQERLLPVRRARKVYIGHHRGEATLLLVSWGYNRVSENTYDLKVLEKLSWRGETQPECDLGSASGFV